MPKAPRRGPFVVLAGAPASCSGAAWSAGPLRVRRRVAKPGSAETDGRTGDPAPEGPDGGRDAQLDPGAGVPADEVVDNDPLDGLHRLIGDPVPAHLVRPELACGQPVGVQAAGEHPVQPAG